MPSRVDKGKKPTIDHSGSGSEQKPQFTAVVMGLSTIDRRYNIKRRRLIFEGLSTKGMPSYLSGILDRRLSNDFRKSPSSLKF